jgi:hypothetical protein
MSETDDGEGGSDQQQRPSPLDSPSMMSSDVRADLRKHDLNLNLHLTGRLTTTSIGREKSRDSAEHVSYVDIQFSDPESSSAVSGVKYLDVDWTSLPTCLAECSGSVTLTGDVLTGDMLTGDAEYPDDNLSTSSSDVSYNGSSRSLSPEEEVDYVLERVRTRRGSWMTSTDDVKGQRSTTSSTPYGTFLLCHGHPRHHLLVPIALPLARTPSPETLFESIVDALSASTDSLDDLKQWRDTVARHRCGDWRHIPHVTDDVTEPAAASLATSTASILRLPLVHVTKCDIINDDESDWPMADVEGRHASLPTRGCRMSRRLRLRPQSVALSTRFMSLGRRETDRDVIVRVHRLGTETG